MESVREVPQTSSKLCAPFATPGLTLSEVGGKGLNLAKLAQAGFPVPDGFIITTKGYDAFVASAGLTDWIVQQVVDTDTADPDALETLSRRIRARFQESAVPDEVARAIRAGYEALGPSKVAVRSSATAEDLPDLSCAGQQDTILNVLGHEPLLDAVVACWSSLWTARAIGYRARNGIDQAGVSLAVVVQQMVQSETSGVLFTANPLTGRRTETVIDATFGLGEALVSGQVEPDHYVVETRSGRILEKNLGAKATVIRGLKDGGTETVQSTATGQQALTDEQIRELTELGRNVAGFYGSPQDIEWGYADGVLYLLQSRPITSLYPLPPVGDEDDLRVFISFGAVQGVLDPFTPLGRDMLRVLMAGGARLFGLKLTIRNQPIVYEAGERLWGDLTGLMRHPIGRRILSRAFLVIEPGASDAVEQLMADPRLPEGTVKPETLRRLRPFIFRLLKSFPTILRQPEASAKAFQADIDGLVASYAERAQRSQTLAQRITLCEQIVYNAFPFQVPRFIPPMLIGYLSLTVLSKLTEKLSQTNPEIPAQLALDLTRGLPNNVTTEMDLFLWETARRIRQDDAACALFLQTDPEDLARSYEGQSLPPSIQQPLADFLERYGMRGLGEIDFGRPRWRERPATVIRTLQSYLAIEDEDAAPDVVFRRGEAAAAQAIERMAAAASQRADSALAGRLVRALARWVRALAGLRESPKFTIIRLMGIARTGLLESGQELVEAGVLERADDLFFLQLDELKVLAMGAPGDWKRLVQGRRDAYAREQRRKNIPRLLLSDGTAIYEGITSSEQDGDNVLAGSGVSPGVVEGTVRLVFEPHNAQLQPGEILVCPGTDPAWTPLFLAAGGLVMEVGGMMTHGSVVAREYGIPAVVGVDRATERLKTGQRVRVDGGSGRVEIVAEQ